MSPERNALREAINAHRQALEKVATAKDTLQKANDLASALSAELAEFSGLDDEIALARAEQMKLCLANGADHFQPFDDANFASRLIARDNVLERQLQVSGTIPVLEKELADADADATNCDLAREHAAAIVFAKEAERLANKFNAEVGELKRQSYILNAMAFRQTRRSTSARSIGGVQPFYAPIPMPLAVREACAENVLGNHEAKYGFAMRNSSTFAVNAFWAALQRNADAMLGEEPQDDAQKAEAAE